MQPIVVTVGPLATGNISNIGAAQKPNANTVFVLNGSLATKASQFTGNSTSNVLNVSALTSGFVTIGQTISGAQVLGNTTIVGLGNGTGGVGTYIINPPQTVVSTTMYGNALATTDKPREIIFTSDSGNEAANTFTIFGTDWAGSTISEQLTGAIGNGTATSVLSYATVSQITTSGNLTGNVSVGTGNIASSPWIRLDPWAVTYVAIQCTVSGTVNYTVQQTLDDPNSATNPVSVGNMTWVNSSDAAAVGATSTIQTNYGFAPVFTRTLLNSGNGTVTMTVSQGGVVNL